VWHARRWRIEALCGLVPGAVGRQAVVPTSSSSRRTLTRRFYDVRVRAEVGRAEMRHDSEEARVTADAGDTRAVGRGAGATRRTLMGLAGGTGTAAGGAALGDR